MIVDTSAIVAILKCEPGSVALLKRLNSAGSASLSAASYVETAIVLDSRRDPVLSSGLDDLIFEANILIEPLTDAQAKIARQAYRDYGKGSGHPANLNFGDCFSYALARDKREPILYKGVDFGHTDLRSALSQP
jgi:ribonuclease VapC